MHRIRKTHGHIQEKITDMQERTAELLKQQVRSPDPGVGSCLCSQLRRSALTPPGFAGGQPGPELQSVHEDGAGGQDQEEGAAALGRGVGREVPRGSRVRVYAFSRMVLITSPLW